MTKLRSIQQLRRTTIRSNERKHTNEIFILLLTYQYVTNTISLIIDT